jgi:hypothetical protein
MELNLKRLHKTAHETIGELYVDGVFECYTLEDKEREVKIKSETAIPKGTYKVIINISNRFKKTMPLLVDVPNFEGIRIHSGNTNHDTEGCILVGKTRGDDYIGGSRVAFAKLMEKLKKAKSISITISCFLLFMFCSCGARKRDQTKVVEDLKTSSQTTMVDTTKTKKAKTKNIKKTVTTKKNDKTKTTIKTTVQEPIDGSKPGIIENPDGTKTVLNNSKQTTTKTEVLNDKKETKAKDIKQDESDGEIEDKGLSGSTADKSDGNKSAEENHVDRKGVSFSTILWLILIIILLLIWIFRKNIPYVKNLFIDKSLNQ